MRATLFLQGFPRVAGQLGLPSAPSCPNYWAVTEAAWCDPQGAAAPESTAALSWPQISLATAFPPNLEMLCLGKAFADTRGWGVGEIQWWGWGARLCQGPMLRSCCGAVRVASCPSHRLNVWELAAGAFHGMLVKPQLKGSGCFSPGQMASLVAFSCHATMTL